MSDMKGQRLIGKERNCLFCDIASGQKEEEIVYQDDKFVVFPAKDLSAPVHLLLIPKKHLSIKGSHVKEKEEVLGHIFALARDMAKKMGVEESYKLLANAGEAASEGSDHLHMHLVGGWESPTKVKHV
ncbi:MAG: Bis(5'-nucleosyl)-tetraphosphatase (Asymmetrical) [candidate division CPR1 bacterium GW2011_GWC1_49_13]|uniref:Bis(5'-nucleosyl)-tetraphosphatase (Asymmetrical) n=1 Tax=candidate division CPR1 bacterium GW2011_GWC1_49_13 TaxID=1618342 RepID=A0A0G1VGL4_9BACT|nr:MAG: Bis(5'-nucleosyl)-tetraphosphatase (Asymmetrical) [candidate division CPR1 bacterium GW2011_GWC1_49_13]